MCGFIIPSNVWLYAWRVVHSIRWRVCVALLDEVPFELVETLKCTELLVCVIDLSVGMLMNRLAACCWVCVSEIGYCIYGWVVVGPFGEVIDWLAARRDSWSVLRCLVPGDTFSCMS